jgi:hypothetical protein
MTERPRQPTVANQPRRTPLDRIHHTLDHILATLKEIAVKQAEYDAMIAPFLEVAKRIVDREANEAAEPALDTSAFTKAVADLDAVDAAQAARLAPPADPTPAAPAETPTPDAPRSEYTFDGDPSTVDAAEWTPAGTAPDGRALYHFAGDTAPGDAKGVAGPWHLYTPPAA